MNKKLKHGLDYIGVAANAFIEHDNKYLLIKRSQKSIEGNKWAFPGGCTEFGEKMMNTIKREIAEETGLKPKEFKFAFYYDSIGTPKNHHFLVIWYAAKVKNAKLIYGDEGVQEFKWMTKAEIRKTKLAFHHNRAFEKYLKSKK